MNFNKTVSIYTQKRTDDGYGGSVFSYALHKTIKAALAPIRTEYITSSERVTTYQSIKVFTKEEINVEDFIIEYGGKKYKSCSFTDYGKVFLHVMELM